MDKRYEVSGLFSLEVEAKDTREAEMKAGRILKDSGIDGCAIEAQERSE